MTPDSSLAEAVAQLFHESYERLAPEYNYQTRPASAVPWSQVPENNRELMIAVAEHVLSRLQAVASIDAQNVMRFTVALKTD